jgi:hypothetical protein
MSKTVAGQNLAKEAPFVEDSMPQGPCKIGIGRANRAGFKLWT